MPSAPAHAQGALAWLADAVQATSDASAWYVHTTYTSCERLREAWGHDTTEARAAIVGLLRAYVQAPSATAMHVAQALHTGLPACSDAVADLLWALDWEYEARAESPEALPLDTARARLAELVCAGLAVGLWTRDHISLRLDAPLLGAAHVVEPTVFHRRGIQIRTASYFKQTKYNLLREESEGYASVLVALLTHRAPPLSVDEHGTVQESMAASELDAYADALLQRLWALIGYFALDASRVLDLLLAVFTKHVAHHHPFYVRVLARSRWDASRIAQILGQQLSYYAQPDTRDDAPDELFLVVALLVRHDVVAWEDVYPYLAPDDTMARLQSAYEEALAAKGAAGANALAMAAPLVDEDAPAETQAAQAAPTAPPAPPCGHAAMAVRAMLACGLLEPVQPFLAQYPWVLGAFPSVTRAYVRLVWYRLAPALASVALPTPPVPVMKRTPVLTVYAPEPHASATHTFVFCVPDWAAHLVQETDATAVLPMLAPLGVHVAQDARLLQVLCRLCVHAQDRAPWMQVLRTQILPAVALAEAGAPLLYELWACVESLTYPERYALYGEWKHRAFQRRELRAAKAATEREARGILRRVSADNVRASGRSLAKAAHTNPIIFFDVVLHQVQSYDNLIEPVVDAVKYLTPLEYDVCSFALLEALSNPARERIKSDGTHASLWLKSLASFAGAFFRKYAVADCTPVLQYLVNQLHQGHGNDLIVLSELVLKMAGIEPVGELSDAQTAALSGGPLLQSEATLTLIAAPTPTAALLARNALKKGGARLHRTLVQSRLALALLVLMAQHRQRCVFETEAHIKSLSSAYDTVQSYLFQYAHFLAAQGAQAYAELVPSPVDWIRRFGVDVPMAFHLARPKLVYEMQPTESKLEAPAHVDEMEIEQEDKASPAEPTQAMPVEPTEPWHAALVPVITGLREALPSNALSEIGAAFFTTFWQLALSDITVPMERYQHEMARLRQSLRDVDGAVDLSDSLKKSARVRLQENVAQLTAELKAQTLSHQATRRRLQAERDHWFAPDVHRGRLAQQLVAQCLLPRALLSPTDALFAARFLRMLHTLQTPHLPTLAVYDVVLCQHVAPTLFAATENEARNYARFLHGVLSDVHAWLELHVYEKEAAPHMHLGWEGHRGLPGRPSEAPLSHAAFKGTMLRWHTKLYEAFLACFGTEYMRMRNAIVVLNRLSAFFPLLAAHGQALLEAVERVSHSDSRGDLKVLAHGLVATLKKQRSTWVDVRFFRRLTREERAAEAQAKAEAEAQAKAHEEARQQQERERAEKEREGAEQERLAKEKAEAAARQRVEAAREEAQRTRKAKEPQGKAEREKDEPRELHMRGSGEGRGKMTRSERKREREERAMERSERDDRGAERSTGPERGGRAEPLNDRGQGRGTDRNDRDRDRDRRGRWNWDRGYERARDDRRLKSDDRIETNAQWQRRGDAQEADDSARQDEQHGRKRSLADRLHNTDSAAHDTQTPTEAPDNKRMRKDRTPQRQRQSDEREQVRDPPAHSWRERERPARSWGRERPSDVPREHRERDRRKRRAGGD